MKDIARRFVDWLRKGGGEVAQLEAPRPPSSEPEVLGAKEERWLEHLIEDLSHGRRTDALDQPELAETLDSLWQAGHERLAISWHEKILAVPSLTDPLRAPLRARLVELYERRGDLASALSHLEALTRQPSRAVRAHYLLAEHYRRTGNELDAMHHYEAVLARDVDYPNVRMRLDQLRAQRGQDDGPAEGATLAGPGAEALAGSGGARYRLLRELGRGATGVVYLARDGELDRDVAVKLLHPHVASAGRSGAVARFFTEARLAASLRHRNIVAILDLDEAARRIVMELAGGGTLREVLRERGPRTVERALERHAQILSALAAAHRRGIVHRDLKPANLMFRRDPDAPGSEVVLGDFGVAHLPAEADAQNSDRDPARRQRDAVGTLAYMAPEQRKLGEASERSDLYSAAVVLFEMLTGRYPWPPHVLLGGMRKPGDFQLPSALLAGVPTDLAEMVQDHLHQLGNPDLAMRPDTTDALAVASELRDRALAYLA